MNEVFEEEVSRQIERLKQKTLREIESETVEKRLGWLSVQATQRHLTRPVTPRTVFEALFFEYMGLRPQDIPVLSESDWQITWSSRNPCPTLEACRRVKMDTREVCKGAYHRSTQAFLSWFDPQLRFLRDYREIRPYAFHCKEQIVRIDFTTLMRLAIERAGASRQTGNKGYGAVVVLGERILSCRHDTASSERDPSLHAEVNAIRDAVRALGQADLTGAVLISTCEPCPMCSSLAVWSNLSAMVYGASIESTARLGKARIRVSAREVADRSPIRIEVIPRVLEEECLQLYS